MITTCFPRARLWAASSRMTVHTVARGSGALLMATAATAVRPILGADAVHMAEGNISGRVIASAWTTRRGQRPWHVQTLLAREPGDLAIDRSATAAGPHREGEEP